MWKKVQPPQKAAKKIFFHENVPPTYVLDKGVCIRQRQRFFLLKIDIYSIQYYVK